MQFEEHHYKVIDQLLTHRKTIDIFQYNIPRIIPSISGSTTGITHNGISHFVFKAEYILLVFPQGFKTVLKSQFNLIPNIP